MTLQRQAPTAASSGGGRVRLPQTEDYKRGYEAGYNAAHYRAGRDPLSIHRPARWNPDLQEFELQCPECLAKCRPSYWPLTLEFWLPRTVRRCRACAAERDRAKQRARRTDPAVRARDAAGQAAWRERNPGYNTATSALWRAHNPERKRASDRARSLARKAARAA